MRRLEIEGAEIMRIAVRQEIQRSEVSRYDHRLHGILLVCSGFSCNKVAEIFGAGSTWAAVTGQAFMQSYMESAANANSLADPLLRGVSRTNDGMLDPRLKFQSPALSDLRSLPPGDSFFTSVNYRGAFGTSDSWLIGWTALDMLGFLGDLDGGQPDTTTVEVTCDVNGDGRATISDVIYLILSAKVNPNDPRWDYNRSGSYTIADPVALLRDIIWRTCPVLASQMFASLAGSGPQADVVEGLSSEEVAYVGEVIRQMGLSEEEEAALRLALYGGGRPASLPRAFSLSQNAPNPFNPSTTITFEVPEGRSERVNITVYDLHGRLISTLADGIRQAGVHQIFWAGTDSNGRRLASGVYFYRMSAGAFVQTRKLVLLK